jgi:purine-binding chemotaxis protein CheW
MNGKAVGNDIDWQNVRVKLEQAGRILAGQSDRPATDARRILKERARKLARPLSAPHPLTAMKEVLVFALTGVRYAIETRHVVEVVRLSDITPLPCTPEFLLGVVNLRGRILPVLDFRRLFDLSGEGIKDGQIVAVEAAEMTFGIYTESVEGTVRLETADISSPPAAMAGDPRGYIRGVTGTMIGVLDLEALAQDPRILINQTTTTDRER